MSSAPNVVFVLMDDMGWGDMSCYGSPAIKTPVMDSIAAQGVKFTSMYAAAPTCTPSRCGLMTGRYAQRVGLSRVLYPDDTAGLTDAEITIADCLKARGYATCAIGKWHLGCLPAHHPLRHGFDTFFGLLYSNDMQPMWLYNDETIIDKDVDQAYLTKQYTDKAIDFMRDHKHESFFIYLAHTMPHIPLHVEPAFRGRSAAGTYGDTIECIDFHLGRLLAELKALGLEENTLVIVTSDNGPWYEGSTGPFRGRKFENYEGGQRMPFVAKWPAVIPVGTVCDEAASLMDMLPTITRWAGGMEPQDRVLDGKNIQSLFLGKGSSPHRALYYFHHNSLNAIRVGKWKLHVSRGKQGEQVREMPQLFDLEIDPGEHYNVANLHPEIVVELNTMIREFAAQIRYLRAPLPDRVKSA